MNVYLSGPMTGKPEWNFPAFNKAARVLRSMGYEVQNPAELTPPPAPGEINSAEDELRFWQGCLREDIKALCDCTGLILLPGFESSKGAMLELHVAHRLGLQVLQYRDLDFAAYGLDEEECRL